MDAASKAGVFRGFAQDIVTYEELVELFESEGHPIAYDGFEPSGVAHLPVGVYRPLLLKQMLSTGVRFKLLLADSYAWINEKMGGDLARIKLVGDYFVEVWKAAGVPFSAKPTAGKVCVVSHYADFVSDKEYWFKVFQVGRHHSEARTKRALTIAGRGEADIRQAAQLFYPSMQAADIFQLADDPVKEPIICQLGLDQRKANMLARDMADKLGYKKPVAVHHRILLGLDGESSASAADEPGRPASASAPSIRLGPAGSDEGVTGSDADERVLKYKMSKSRPESCIFVHDSIELIASKLSKAYCPAKIVAGNPVLEYAREMVFRAKSELTVERPAKFGGELAFTSYGELEKAFVDGGLHPMDLKTAVARELDLLIAPVRTHFESGSGRKLLDEIREFEVTR